MKINNETKRISRRCRQLTILFVSALLFCFTFRTYLKKDIPDEITVIQGMEPSFSKNPFLSYKRVSENTFRASAFQFLDVKDITVNTIPDIKLYPGGDHIGIYLKTKGVLVIGTGTVKCENGKTACPAKNILCVNDYITSINHEPVSSKSQLNYLIDKYGQSEVHLSVIRQGENLEFTLHPVKSMDGSYKLGIWVRDDTQGIGTVTYACSDGSFGALGHGIADMDTGDLLACDGGTLYSANIWGIRKGTKGVLGTPGGLLGNIIYEKTHIIGTINQNTMHGIFGKMDSTQDIFLRTPLEIGLKNEVKKGPAIILCALLEGHIEEYEIEIINVDYDNASTVKGMVISVTDNRLLSQTGGIVAGMSGSPIIQNGKIIGAVTHVFVDDPAKGYGIFIEEMLKDK